MASGAPNIGPFLSPFEGQKKRVPAQNRLKLLAPKRKPERFCLDTVDLQALQQELSEAADQQCEEDQDLLEAVDLAMVGQLDVARESADFVLNDHPASSGALLVSAAECEARQDWSEAARSFLAGVGHNGADDVMEHGFQTNMEMLRAYRNRHVVRPEYSKWDDVLTFKPKPPAVRPPSPHTKPAWYRLGPLFEELLGSEEEGGPHYLEDLISAQADPEHEREGLRRVLYTHMDFLSAMYEYYRNDQADGREDADEPFPAALHTGHVENDDDPDIMKLSGFWRILKESVIASGGVKVKQPVAVFDRVHALGQRRLAKLTSADPNFDISASNPHHREMPVPYYNLIETLIRTANIKVLAGHGIADKFESLIREYLLPGTMHENADKEYLATRDFRMQRAMFEEDGERCLRKVFEYYIVSYKATKLRSTSVGPQDTTMSFNHIFVMFEKLQAFDPNFSVKKLMEAYCKITCDSDLLPQEHPNNQNSEMVFYEFVEILVRLAPTKYPGKNSQMEAFVAFVDEWFIPAASRLMPGKLERVGPR